jgi:hypothetical protein
MQKPSAEAIAFSSCCLVSGLPISSFTERLDMIVGNAPLG